MILLVHIALPQLNVTVHLAVAPDDHKTQIVCDKQHYFTQPRPLEPLKTQIRTRSTANTTHTLDHAYTLPLNG